MAVAHDLHQQQVDQQENDGMPFSFTAYSLKVAARNN